MKKITLGLIIATMVMFENRAIAQYETPGGNYTNTGFYVGVRGIPQLSWMINKDDADNSNYETQAKFGVGFGVGAGYNFTENMGVALDALYSIQGKRYKLGNTEYNQRLDYIKIPLMFTFVSNPAPVMFTAKIGPQLSILTLGEIDPVIVNGLVTSDNKAHFENLVFGGAASAGARFAITGNLWIDATLHFDATFTDVENKGHALFPAGRANTYNMTPGIEIGANYLIK